MNRECENESELKGMCLDCCTQIEGLLKETGDELSECPLCQASVPELFVCEEADLIQKAILAA